AKNNLLLKCFSCILRTLWINLSRIYGDESGSFIESRRNGKEAFGSGPGPADGPDAIKRGPQVWCQPHHSFAVESGSTPEGRGVAKNAPRHGTALPPQPRPVPDDPRNLRAGCGYPWLPG